MSAQQQVQNAAAHVAARRGNVPHLRMLLGALLVIFFLLALMLQVQTSEAFILVGKSVGFSPDWSILVQPYLLATSKLKPDIAKAVMWGWGIELVYLVCVIGEVAVHGRLQGWFKTGALVLVGFDFWTDFNYGSLASGLFGQFAFAAITSFIVAFFGMVGLNLIFDALAELL